MVFDLSNAFFQGSTTIYLGKVRGCPILQIQMTVTCIIHGQQLKACSIMS